VNLDETPAELAARTGLAKTMQTLGHALVAYQIDARAAQDLERVASRVAAEISRGVRRDRAMEMLTSPRVIAALEGRRAVIENGAEIDLFRDSFVSGRTNPMGVGVRVVRRGDTAVATTSLGAAFEGAPGRAHGGVVGAILDETMGYVLPIIGVMAYTANLNIDYVAPAPLETDLTFTARLRDRDDRKLWIEAVGESPEGVFVRAEALFLTVDLSRFTNGAGTQ
jgi:acyl-coenzyme A thioesterase PaaI-like protein